MAQNGPKWLKMAKNGQNGPKMAQKWPKNGPKMAQKWPQNGPKLTQ